MKQKTVILYSAGLDSFVMAKYAEALGHEVIKIWFDIGQEYASKERDRLPEDVNIHEITGWIGSFSQAVEKPDSNNGPIFIPGRNGVLSVLAASIYLPDEVWLGVTQGENYETATDKNLPFMMKANELTSYMLSPWAKKTSGFYWPLIKFPLVENGWTKSDLIKQAIQNNWSTPEALRSTYSCHFETGTKYHCGTCKNCFRRHFAFLSNDIDDSEDYLLLPEEGPSFCVFVDELREGTRGLARKLEVQAGLKKVGILI